MTLNLLDPFLASRVDLVSRNDVYGGGGYTYGGLYKYHDMLRFDGYQFLTRLQQSLIIWTLC
jgi:hypothetical protein